MSKFEITYSLLNEHDMLKAILLMQCRSLVVQEILAQKVAAITGESPENIRLEIDSIAYARANKIMADLMISMNETPVEERLNEILKDQDLGKLDDEDDD